MVNVCYVNKRWHHQLDCDLTSGLACVASIFVGLKSKEGSKNGIFTVLHTWNWGESQKKERGEAKYQKSCSSVFLCFTTPPNCLLHRLPVESFIYPLNKSTARILRLFVLCPLLFLVIFFKHVLNMFCLANYCILPFAIFLQEEVGLIPRICKVTSIKSSTFSLILCCFRNLWIPPIFGIFGLNYEPLCFTLVISSDVL